MRVKLTIPIFLLILLSSVFLQGQVFSAAPLLIHFLDVGYGDAIVLRLPEGGALLVDGGDPEHGPQVAARLRNMGIMRLDYVVISHFHKDHAGGLGYILPQFLCWQREPPDGGGGEILIPLVPDQVEPEVESIKAELERCPSRIIRRGDSIALSPSVHLEVLHPHTLRGNPNEDSLVLRVIHGANTILLAGDVGVEGQKELEEVYGSGLQADLLKIPHHGSGGVASFLRAVQPNYAILTIGPNPYGAPEEGLLNLYQSMGIPVFRTDRDGAITVISDSHALQVEVERVQ